MKKQGKDQSEAKELRQDAEEELRTRKSTKTLSEVDKLELIYELQIHQIELEMQNEEIINASKTMEKYVDLFDFAPSGYVTLSEEGEITDLNFSAAKMLGNDRIHLKNKRFGLFIAPESLYLFNELFENIFRFRKKESCELLLQSSPDKPCYIHVDALVSQDTNTLLIAMIDVSERKKMELELIRTTSELKQLNSYFIDRELRMIDLKKEINELLIKSGCEQEYLI